MNHDERDNLWELLGRAREPKVSPFFARDVLRKLRAEESAPGGLLVWLLRRWPIAAAAACALVFAGVTLVPRPEPAVSVVAMAEHVSASPDYAVIGNLDELLAAEESSAWLTHSVD